MQTTSILNNVIDSETFGDGGRHYFFDLKRTVDNRPFLQITRSDALEDGYQRNFIIIFESDLPFFVEALSMLLGRFSAGETLNN
jgi:hypothetical protein